MIGTLIFSLPDVFTTTDFAPVLSRVWFDSMAKYTRISLIFSFLAWNVMVRVAKSSHTGKQWVSPWSFGNFEQCKFLWQRENLLLGVTFTSELRIHATWCVILRVPSHCALLCHVIATPVFRHIREVAKNDYQLCHVCLSICLHGTAWLLLNEISCNLIFGYFSNICLENSSFSNICLENSSFSNICLENSSFVKVGRE
jgi:hypothetical protein